jgi:hypothetical protein
MKHHHLNTNELTFPPIMPPPLDSGFGLPHERATRVAARRIFVAMKRVFLDAASMLDGSAGVQLRRRIRLALEPTDLLVLQNDLLDALPSDDERSAQHRHALYRQLDQLFPDTALTGFVPLSAAEGFHRPR